MPAFNNIHNQRLASILGMHRLLRMHARRPVEYYNSGRRVMPLFDTSRLSKRKVSNYPLTDCKDINDYTRNFINTRFDPKEGTDNKQPSPSVGYTIKQKRVKVPTPVNTTILPSQLDLWDATRVRVMARESIKSNSAKLKAQGIDVALLQKLIARSCEHSDILEVQMSRRLLRTNRTLVLPAQVNLTLITNSYDVVHS